MANKVRQACVPHAVPVTRHTVRVQIPQAKGLPNAEILKEVKKTIAGAAAIRVLKSGDIDVAVPDEATRDRAQGLPSTKDFKIFKRDYLVEIPGVLLTTQIADGKNADNAQLASAICEASRTISPGLQITRIRWLHAQRTPAQRMRDVCEGRKKTRGSLIVGFLTEEMQRTAIRGGLIIDAQLFETRPFDKSLQVTRCFKCQQWGHTQAMCGKHARCAQCAGPHATTECMNERISCANCGKGHRAFQCRECPSFQTYYEGIQRRRVAMYAQAQSMRTMTYNAPTAKDKQKAPGQSAAGGLDAPFPLAGDSHAVRMWCQRHPRLSGAH